LLGEVSGQSSRAGPHIEHSATSSDSERAENVRPQPRQVIAGRPIVNGASQFVRSR
jgi:hypothetical protein